MPLYDSGFIESHSIGFIASGTKHHNLRPLGQRSLCVNTNVAFNYFPCHIVFYIFYFITDAITEISLLSFFITNVSVCKNRVPKITYNYISPLQLQYVKFAYFCPAYVLYVFANIKFFLVS